MAAKRTPPGIGGLTEARHGLRSSQANKPELYQDVAEELNPLLAGETDSVANLANAAAVLFTVCRT